MKTAWCDVDSFFIVGDWAHLPTLAVILARWRRRAPVALWVDTPVEDLERPVLKQWLGGVLEVAVAQPDIIFGTGSKAKRVLLEMGVRAEQFVDLPFLVDLDRPRLAGREERFGIKLKSCEKLCNVGPKVWFSPCWEDWWP